MNQRIPVSKAWPGTQAAEGLPRWRWTVAEIERVAAAGLFADGDRFELLGGEMVPMSPKGRRHEMIRLELSYRWTRMASEAVMIAAEPQFNLDADTYLNPDILVHSRSKATYDLRGPEAMLVVEIAGTSLACDLNTKSSLYAASGVPEYWVINAVTLQTTIFRQPSTQGYIDSEEFPAGTRLVPVLVPELTIDLNTIDSQMPD
jgi:Uma2 family endonuclease